MPKCHEYPSIKKIRRWLWSFPLILIEEILSWVPAKSLTLLRYTCKQWKTLIVNPRFVYKHSSHMRCREKQFSVFNMVSMPNVPLSSTISFIGMNFDEFSNPCMNLHVFHLRCTICFIVMVYWDSSCETNF